jgi:hypothetical protein
MAGTFDTLRAARRLKEAGASEPVAEAIAEVLRDSRELDLSRLATKTDLEQLRLATKTDLEQLRLATKTDLEQLRLATKTDLEQLRLATKADLAELKSEVLKWVIGLMIAQTAAIIAVVKLLLGHA